MKPRRAAGLVLIGWYLMLPPVTPSGVIVSDSPAHHYPGWTVMAHFENYQDCSRAQYALLGQAMRESLDWPIDQIGRDKTDAAKVLAAVCNRY